MHRFFVENITGDLVVLNKSDRQHIAKVLRMKEGQEVIVSDEKFNDYLCVIEQIQKKEVILKVIRKTKNNNEPNIDVWVYQALPKLSKLEFIVQKCVELGAKGIVPVITRRCVANIKCEDVDRKLLRLRKIAKSAAQQSGRAIIPHIGNILTFSQAIEDIKKADLKVLFYEYGKLNLNNIDVCGNKKISFFVGSEGGFEDSEVEFAKEVGILIGSLGKRILRCETAPICALSVFMYISGNL